MMFCFAVSFVLLFCSLTASASFSEYSDVPSHWAVSSLEKAYDEGILVGFEDNTMRPDAPISEAEVLTILCRVFNTQNRIDASALGLSGTEWYVDTAEKAAAMNLISDGSGLSKKTLSRADAFLLLSKAFQLTQAAPDEAPLKNFTDLKQLRSNERSAILSLMRWGGLKGYENHTLRPQGSISRAEFVTMLYRIAPYQKTVSELTEPLDGGVLISDQVHLENEVFSSPVYLDCTAENLSLQRVTADLIVVRSQKTSDISLDDSQLDTLILSGGNGNSSNIAPSGTSKIQTLVVGDRNGKLTVSGNVSRLEVTGNGQTITVNTALDELVISGVGSQITLTDSGSIRTIQLTDGSSINSIALSKPVSNLVLDGTKNKIISNGLVETLSLSGKENELTGGGSVRIASIYTTRSTVALPCEQTINQTDHGITDVSLRLSAPEVLPIGNTLTITATLQNSEEKRCKAQWIVGGTVVKEDFLTVGPQWGTTTYICNFEYKQNMNTNFQVLFQLLYTTKDGLEQTASATATTTLENYSLNYYEAYSKEKVLSRVTTGYQGDYTLPWAKKNDYDELTKTIWVNAKEYSSKTNYLIWVSISNQRVNVFEGSQGHWKLSKCFLVGSGAKGTDTPVGVYTVGTRSMNGWTTDQYNVRPVVRFKMGSGLAFHSRIYDPNYTRITDGSIGYPVSHGCIRMYDDDVWWIFYVIPKDTTVIVY
jgi:lipoprotein-anchoring transpeptidase ErfK/SrfK